MTAIKIIATAPEGELTRSKCGKISPQPSFEVEWYDEQNDTTRRSPVDADVAESLAPKLFAQSLKAIGWQDRVSRARCM